MAWTDMFGNGGMFATGNSNFGQGKGPIAANGVENIQAGPGSILGMSPNSFAAVAGGMGEAISPKDSWQAKLGGFAKGLGVAQMGMAANKAKAAADLKMFQELIGKGIINPASFSKYTGQHPELGLNPNSEESMYKAFGTPAPTVDNKITTP
jgi:hypothetical protein